MLLIFSQFLLWFHSFGQHFVRDRSSNRIWISHKDDTVSAYICLGTRNWESITEVLSSVDSIHTLSLHFLSRSEDDGLGRLHTRWLMILDSGGVIKDPLSTWLLARDTRKFKCCGLDSLPRETICVLNANLGFSFLFHFLIKL